LHRILQINADETTLYIGAHAEKRMSGKRFGMEPESIRVHKVVLSPYQERISDLQQFSNTLEIAYQSVCDIRPEEVAAEIYNSS